MNTFFECPQGAALKILAETLWNSGFKVYLAGGCVRDHLLGRPYNDLDVVTDASVTEIQNLFEKTIPVGIQFGIVRVIVLGVEFEVARFRRDGPYLDGRHPEFVEFVGPEDDAARRDFTINALFFDLKNNTILDFVGGKKDLEAQLLRTVGSPAARFTEDYLRILRLIRFSCQLHFKIETNTEAAAKNLVSHLTSVSGERICIELTKTLTADPLQILSYLRDWKIMPILFPEWKESSLSQKVYSFFYDKPLEGNSTGLLLSLLILNFQGQEALNSIEVISPTQWIYNKNYLQSISEIVHLLKISNKDEKILKAAASVLSWASQWKLLRMGFRASLAQSEEFKPVLWAAQHLQTKNDPSAVWSQSMLEEVIEWSSKPKLSPLIQGSDLNLLPPEKRGLVMKECLYLQYEGSIKDQEQALAWLQLQIKKL